jgi:molybdenum cofactor guanylyltransferase
VIGAIIAGGSSSRFGGEPKGLLRINGVRIIDRVARALRGVTTDLLLVSNANDAPEWLPGVSTVSDIRPERGSLVGLHTALAHAQDDVMAVAWDMPFVTAELLELIRDRGRAEPFATVPEGERGLEPFCALYTRACIPVFERALDQTALRMSSALSCLPSITRISTLDVSSVGDPARLFFNVNDARDLAIADRMAGGA